MKDRYNNSVIEAEKGIIFEDEKGASEENIRVTDIEEDNVCFKNYANPPIPEGYKHVEGKWNDGFVIESDCEEIKKGSQFVWIPVGSLKSNGTLDGVSFNEKFGRRNYQDEEVIFSDKNFWKLKKELNERNCTTDIFFEEMTDEFILQKKSVKKYGGFYISRYNISFEEGYPVSKRYKFPSVFEKEEEPIGLDEYNIVINSGAANPKDISDFPFDDGKGVKCHLVFGAEYDSVLEWFIESTARTYSEIAEDSTNWGNYYNIEDPVKRIHLTGDNEKWCTNRIYDFAGNVEEWTQEKVIKYGIGDFYVVRGGSCWNEGYNYPVAYRNFRHISIFHANEFTSFRIALYIE